MPVFTRGTSVQSTLTFKITNFNSKIAPYRGLPRQPAWVDLPGAGGHLGLERGAGAGVVEVGGEVARVAAAGAAQEVSILLAKNHALATTAQLSAVTISTCI